MLAMLMLFDTMVIVWSNKYVLMYILFLSIGAVTRVQSVSTGDIRSWMPSSYHIRELFGFAQSKSRLTSLLDGSRWCVTALLTSLTLMQNIPWKMNMSVTNCIIGSYSRVVNS